MHAIAVATGCAWSFLATIVLPHTSPVALPNPVASSSTTTILSKSHEPVLLLCQRYALRATSAGSASPREPPDAREQSRHAHCAFLSNTYHSPARTDPNPRKLTRSPPDALEQSRWPNCDCCASRYLAELPAPMRPTHRLLMLAVPRPLESHGSGSALSAPALFLPSENRA